MSAHKLVIAEKPSVAKSIGEVLGAKSKKDGFYEGAGYIITWCVGHLLELAPPDSYDAKYGKWRIADLPILPEVYKHTPYEKTKKQLRIIKDLLKRPDIEAVINACDSGREGELIFRLVYTHCNCRKPLFRLWISSLESSTISAGFKNLRSGSDYDNLHQAALSRQKADWAVGINYSRLYGCLYNGRISIGRVQTPTLAMIVARELKIKNFVKEPHYIVEIAGNGLVAAREKLPDKTQAENIRQKCDGATATIKSVTRKEKSESPQKLYDLTTLQREANRLFGYTAADTLQAAQNLYEQKLLTYPRTDSRFITDDMAAGIPKLVEHAAETLMGLQIPITVDVVNPAQVTNNAKVTDHHAIITTLGAASVNISSLPEKERNIFLMVCMRLISAVSAKHTYAETVITAECEGEIFTAKGKTVIKGGWKAIEQVFSRHFKKQKPDEEKPLPAVAEGQQFTAEASVREGSSQPPPHFTEDLLLKAMENAGVDDMPEDTENFKGIGTPATRAETIEKLLRAGYIERKDKKILPTEKGFELIRVLPDNDPIKSALLTAEWESALKKVENGELSADAFMDSINSYVREVVKNNATAQATGGALSGGALSGGTTARERVGSCPRCNGDVVDKPKCFSCVNSGCGFVLFKETKFFTAKKKKITKAVAVAFLTEGKIFMPDLYSSKTQKTYKATIFLVDDDPTTYPSFRMEFENRQ